MEFSAVNTIWVLVGAALVFFMQAGFAMVETGFTRAKNAGNIIMKNLMDFAIGTPLYWLTGFGIMFAGSGAFIGGFDPFVRGDYSAILPAGVPLPAYLIFQTVFCATAATIVSGAMAERTKFISYCIYSAVISAIVYPISGHWIWGGGFHMLGIQLLGVVSVILWVTITMVIVFNLLKHTIGLRASVEEETKGLDVTEHNLASSYADFMPVVFTGREDAPAVSAAPVSVEKSVPVEHFPQSETTISGNGSGAKLTKVVMIFNQSRFVALKEALTELGVTGMTITQVMGCGTQKGHTNYYRGIKVEEAALLPKIKLEVVVSKVPVADVIALAKKVLYTGHIGDGKIFVYDVENVVKVRTGEEGYDALQGD